MYDRFVDATHVQNVAAGYLDAADGKPLRALLAMAADFVAIAPAASFGMLRAVPMTAPTSITIPAEPDPAHIVSTGIPIAAGDDGYAT